MDSLIMLRLTVSLLIFLFPALTHSTVTLMLYLDKTNSGFYCSETFWYLSPESFVLCSSFSASKKFIGLLLFLMKILCSLINLAWCHQGFLILVGPWVIGIRIFVLDTYTFVLTSSYGHCISSGLSGCEDIKRMQNMPVSY